MAEVRHPARYIRYSKARKLASEIDPTDQQKLQELKRDEALVAIGSVEKNLCRQLHESLQMIETVLGPSDESHSILAEVMLAIEDIDDGLRIAKRYFKREEFSSAKAIMHRTVTTVWRTSGRELQRMGLRLIASVQYVRHGTGEGLSRGRSTRTKGKCPPCPRCESSETKENGGVKFLKTDGPSQYYACRDCSHTWVVPVSLHSIVP